MRSEAFRETFLFFLDSVEAESFRQFGDILHDRMLDRAVYGEKNPHVSFTLAEMSAAAEDLGYLASFLRNVSLERRWSDLSSTEQSLSSFAERLAPQVRALAEQLEKEIERSISDDEDERSEETPGDGE